MLDTYRPVETPEGVEIGLRVAGPVPRLYAAALDFGLRVLIYIGLAFVVGQLGRGGVGLFFVGLFLVEWFYPVVFEVKWGGATPGKRQMGLQVLQRDGTPVGWTASVIRNLVRFADLLPAAYGFGLGTMLVDRDFRRLGDLAAGTVVVHREPLTPGTRVPAAAPLRPPVSLTLDEQRAVIQFAERLGTWPPARAAELAALLAPLTGVTNPQDPEGVQRLVGMANWLLGATVSREIFEQRHEPQWKALDASLSRLEMGRGDRGGVPDDLPELYRQVCHHLALVRHRHYGADLELRLNRLVLRGHQQLYHRSSVDAAGIFAFARSGFPRLVRREKRLVGLSALLFGVPLLLMTLLVPHHPEIAFSIMTPAAVEQMGQQFSPSGSLEAGRPVDSDILMFGFYIRNNIGIAFRTFAGGILGGVGSIFFLVYNGLAIGTVTGYVRQMGFGPQFFPFAIGHGAFELTAIVLAGAAGLRLGLALLAPGSLSRGRALLLAGRTAIRILYGAAGMLVVAAFLEAFWSPMPQPAATKYGIGAILWLAVFVYLTFAGRPDGP